MWTLATVGIAMLEQTKPVGDRRGQHAVASGKHSTFAQDTNIVERSLNSCEHVTNCGSG